MHLYMRQTDEIDAMIAALKQTKTAIKKRDKLSEKQSALTLDNSTDRRRGKAREDLNWQCIEVDKRKTDVARLFKGSCCDVGTETKYYRPSGFHEYQY